MHIVVSKKDLHELDVIFSKFNIKYEYTILEKNIGNDINDVFVVHIYKIYAKIKIEENTPYYILHVIKDSEPVWLVVYGDTLSSWAFYDANKELKLFSSLDDLEAFLRNHDLSFEMLKGAKHN